MRFAMIPTLFASVDASSIESSHASSDIDTRLGLGQHSRVVITIAFPTATFFSVRHISLFIFASTPLENSSISSTLGFPTSAIASASFRW